MNFIDCLLKFNEASARNPKMADATTKINDSSMNSIDFIDFEAKMVAPGTLVVSLKRKWCSSGTNSLKSA